MTANTKIDSPSVQTPPVSRNKNLLSLQLIRALAAWLVVFHHYVQIVHNFACPSWIGQFFGRHGSFGVQLFFVLSGVVMTIAIKSRPPISCFRDAGTFLTRRLRRIIPAYCVSTILFLALGFQMHFARQIRFAFVFWQPGPVDGNEVVSLFRNLGIRPALRADTSA